jgi:glycerate-2-kinase
MQVKEMAGKTAALGMMRAALDAANPIKAITSQVAVQGSTLFVRNRPVVENLSRYSETYVFGAGKAASQMARAICMVSGVNIDGGLIITKHHHCASEDLVICQKHGIQVAEASHPIPCEAGARATREIIAKLTEIDRSSTLVIWLASGGGSALTGGVGVLPMLTLDALKESMQWLLDSGAEIEQGTVMFTHAEGDWCELTGYFQ